jgi:hypothetical protein
MQSIAFRYLPQESSAFRYNQLNEVKLKNIKKQQTFRKQPKIKSPSLQINEETSLSSMPAVPLSLLSI